MMAFNSKTASKRKASAEDTGLTRERHIVNLVDSNQEHFTTQPQERTRTTQLWCRICNKVVNLFSSPINIAVAHGVSAMHSKKLREANVIRVERQESLIPGFQHPQFDEAQRQEPKKSTG